MIGTYESLVDLKLGNLVDGEASLLEGDGDGESGGGGEVDRGGGGVGEGCLIHQKKRKGEGAKSARPGAKRTYAELTDDASEGGEAELVDLGLVSENQRTRTIVQVTRVGSSDGSILSEHGPQARDLGRDDLLVLLILGDDGISLAGVGEGDGSDLGGEGAGGPSGGGFGVGGEGEGVLVFAGDGVLAGGLIGAGGGEGG